MRTISIILAILILLWIIAKDAKAEIYDAEEIVNAIYIAEGGEEAKKPFGILSVSCNGYKECKEICYNTVVNNFDRWQLWGHKTHKDYLSFLASRYAPVGAENDPTGLNKHWLNNVKSIIRSKR